MPVITVRNAEGDLVTRYDNYGYYYLDHYNADGMAEFLRQWRKDINKEYEEYIVLQKKAANEKDYELAKHYSKVVKDLLKMRKAIVYFINDGGQPDAGAKHIPMALWPVELVEELDFIARQLYLDYG